MTGQGFGAAKLFMSANRFIEAYHTVLGPICKRTGLPPMAVDILMFIANNPSSGTAAEICKCRGLKPGIVSVHIDRLVEKGLLTRGNVPGDRRKTLLTCTGAASDIIDEGRMIQRLFARSLTVGLTDADLCAFRRCLAAIGDNINEICRNGLRAGEKR